MPAKYQLFKTPQKNKEEEKESYHVRLTQKGTVSYERLRKRISYQSSATNGDVDLIIEGLVDNMIEFLQDGYTVEIRGLGYFKAVPKALTVKDPKDMKGQNISFSRVSFKAAKSFTQEMKDMKFERDQEYPVESSFSTEERKERILDYIRNTGLIRSSNCIKINGCSRYMALKDLKELITEDKIKRLGHIKSGCYILKTQG